MEQATTIGPVILCGMSILLTACGDDTRSSVQAPGADTVPKTKVLEAGAAALQTQPPIRAINAYLDGFHFYNGDMKEQMEAHHYCGILNEEVIQCVIYDGNVADAKIMGVEYIVSGRLFGTLPDQEKALWHSHVYEVKSGQLVAPGIPDIAEHELMEKLVGTYGKTWHTWHTDRNDELPLGMPQLMMGFVADGQADSAMIAQRNQRFGIDGEASKRNRADIAAPAIDPGADAWRRGKTIQIHDPTGTHEPAAANASAPTRNARSNEAP